jgi:Icc-related predicted phosphoesterase
VSLLGQVNSGAPYHRHVVRLLVVADEIDDSLTVARLRGMQPDLVLSCGDLGPDYLDFVASAANAPLFYVPGNHDPDSVRSRAYYTGATTAPPPPPGTSLDARVVDEKGLRIAGLGGSVRYTKRRPNQYTQSEMRRRVRRLVWQERLRRLDASPSIDVLVTHAPPYGLGDRDDPAHIGFEAFNVLIESFIHPHGFVRPDRQIGATKIVNAVPHKLLELD